MASEGNMDAAKETAMAVTEAVEEAPAVVEEMGVDAILASHLEARGGKEAIKAIQTVSWSAGMEMMGMNMPLKVQLKRPNKMRQDVEVPAMGAKVVQAFDGSTAWAINPMGGSEDPQKMPDEAAKEMEDRGAIDGSIIVYMEKGYEMTYEGEEMVNDMPAHKIMVQLPEDKTVTVFFDAESYMEVKTVQDGVNPMTGEPGKIATYTSDYREVGGVMMAHKIAAEFNGQPLQAFEIDLIEVNKDIPDSVFEMPAPKVEMN